MNSLFGFLLSRFRGASDPAGLLKKAVQLRNSGNWSEASVLYRQLLKLHPDHPGLLTDLGTIEIKLGNHAEGLKWLDQSLRCDPNQAVALSNRAVGLRFTQRLEEARLSVERAIKLQPDYADAYINLGLVLHDLRLFDQAVSCYERAARLRPEINAFAKLNKGLIKLLNGQFTDGWKLYESRWDSMQHKQARAFSTPLWLGRSSIAGKALLIHPEQGFGDFIQFCRYALEAEKSGAKVVLETPAALVSLASTLPGNITIIRAGDPLPAHDFHCPIMSLPLAFKTTAGSIPRQTPYLYASPAKQEIWRAKLGERRKPRIGLAWSGNPQYMHEGNRRVPLKKLQPLLELPFEFHVLQKDIRPDDAEALSDYSHVLTSHSSDLHDFEDTAALVSEMDLVVSVDTSICHLAGALAKEVWVMLSYVPDFRWLLDSSDCPWYPTATLLRQKTPGVWDDVILEVVSRLKSFPGNTAPAGGA